MRTVLGFLERFCLLLLLLPFVCLRGVVRESYELCRFVVTRQYRRLRPGVALSMTTAKKVVATFAETGQLGRATRVAEDVRAANLDPVTGAVLEGMLSASRDFALQREANETYTEAAEILFRASYMVYSTGLRATHGEPRGE